MKVKLEQIAKKSGYSVATVSRVLAGKAKGRSQSVTEILMTARDLGFKTSSINYKNLSLPLDIALITQHDAEEFYSCLYESFDRISFEKNIHMSIHSAKYSKSIQEQVQLLSKYNDGIILMAPTLDKAGYEGIIKKINSFPLLSIAPVEGNIVPTITFDSYEGGRLAAELLVNSGYRKFGIITGPSEKLEANLRRNGFQDFLRKNKLKINWEFQGDYSFKSGELAFKDLHKKHSKNLGIFSSNDQMALGFLHASSEKGLNIPGDYGIVGYDNMPYSKVFYPKLSTIDTDLDLLAINTLDFIVQKIKSSNEKPVNPTTTLLPVELIKRRTHSHD
jgi:DNA-binding LacI/PurR family transcriptional regulator